MALKECEVELGGELKPKSFMAKDYGHDFSFDNAADLLESMGLPGGLLAMEDVLDCSFNKESGILWIRQKEKTQHYFRHIGRMVSFDTEIHVRVAHRHLHGLSGVKAKELFLWAPVSDVSVLDDGERLKFRSYGGITKTFPAKAFARGE